MHVDGFRFDLASILSRDRGGPAAWPRPPVLWDIESDPVLANVKLIAEAWDAAGSTRSAASSATAGRNGTDGSATTSASFLKGDGETVRSLASGSRQPRRVRAQAARAGAEHQLRHVPRRLHAERPRLVQPEAQRGERRGQPRRRRRQPELELRRRRPDRRSGRSRPAQPPGEELPRRCCCSASARRCC